MDIVMNALEALKMNEECEYLKNSTSLIYTIKIGVNKGKKLYPHCNKEGFYIASLTRFEKDYVYVRTKEELLILIKKGFKIRMSNAEEDIAPSLITIKLY